MGDISPETRRLIDEAVADSRVTVIPQGVTSQSDEIRWNGETNKLEFVDKEAARQRAKGSTAGIWGKRRGPAPDPKVAARRAKIADLIQSGKTGPEIASLVGVSVSTVYQDAMKLGMSIVRASRSPAPGIVAPARSKHDPLVEERRKQVADAFDGKRSATDIADLTGINKRTVVDHLKALGLKAPAGKPGPGVNSPRAIATAARREKVKALAAEGKNGPEIADALGAAISTIHFDCKHLGITLPRKRRRNTGTDRAADRKEKAASKKVAVVRDRRRFKTVPVPMGDPAVLAPEGSTGTIFPGRVFQPDGAEDLLKDGCNQAKIGGDVLVGWLKGARIYTLTLEERATCPTSCRHWLSCYGNSMPHSRRWRHGPELMARVEQEIADLCSQHDRVLVRLHVLGDFWSVEYVDLWARLLERFSGLHVFGFTAHKQGGEIGDYIAAIRNLHPRRFWIRHSDMTGLWGSFTVDFPTQQKTIGDAVVCPEQRDGMSGERKGTHCGNCAVCWSSPVPVAFVTH